MQFDTIIFDFDGTLVDTAGDLTASLNHALALLGRRPVTLDDVRQMVGHGVRRLLELGLGRDGAVRAEDVDAGLSAFLSYYRAHIADETVPFPGVERTLDDLRRAGWKLAVCTNKSIDLAEDLAARLGWEGRFDAFLGVHSRPYRKPDPRILADTLAEAGGTRAIFVGDSKTDADTAKAAGVPLVLTTYGYSTEPIATLGGDRVIDRFSELKGAIGDIVRRYSRNRPDR